MAERRMFALKIIDSDAFLDMSVSAQNLYFHLAMRADDDGFISAPKKIMRMIGASTDDLRILAAKRFILTFDTGIVVIKHWRIHNYIAKDRYTPTIYKEEKKKLFVKANGAYTDHPDGVDELYTPCIQNDNETYTSCIQNDVTGKVRLGKVSKGKVNTDSRKPEASDTPEDETKPLPAEAVKLSHLLADLHTQNIDPGYKVSDAQINGWADHIDKINRIDGRSWQEIEDIIRWVKRSGCFWAPNIMSGKKLRDKFATLYAQSHRTENPVKTKSVLMNDVGCSQHEAPPISAEEKARLDKRAEEFLSDPDIF